MQRHQKVSLQKRDHLIHIFRDRPQAHHTMPQLPRHPTVRRLPWLGICSAQHVGKHAQQFLQLSVWQRQFVRFPRMPPVQRYGHEGKGVLHRVGNDGKTQMVRHLPQGGAFLTLPRPLRPVRRQRVVLETVSDFYSIHLVLNVGFANGLPCLSGCFFFLFSSFSTLNSVKRQQKHRGNPRQSIGQ